LEKQAMIRLSQYHRDKPRTETGRGFFCHLPVKSGLVFA
jgi:hypothetical protein